MATSVALAAKEKGKIVSASPDSPTLEKLSTFSQQIRSALHCFSAVATRTNALWQTHMVCFCSPVRKSQPARMRCGKGDAFKLKRDEIGRNPHECAVAKLSACDLFYRFLSRNPHECAVAKAYCSTNGIVPTLVATRTNALWQSSCGSGGPKSKKVATRTNALWQRTA